VYKRQDAAYVTARWNGGAGTEVYPSSPFVASFVNEILNELVSLNFNGETDQFAWTRTGEYCVGTSTANASVTVVSTSGNSFSVNTDEFLIEPDGTVSVAGVPNYEDLVIADDVIPNKAYVDAAIAAYLNSNLVSAGLVSGGAITDAGGGNIDVALGTGYVKATDSDTGATALYPFATSLGNAIPAWTIRYVGVEYNAGTPQVVIKATDSWTGTTEFPLGNVVNEGGTLHINNNPQQGVNVDEATIHRLYEASPLQRADRLGGLILGETGTRNVTVSAGELYDRLNEFLISAIDTSGADTFDMYLGAVPNVTAQSQWDNANYNNGGVKTALTSNRYANLWFYVEADGGLVGVYGTAQYTSVAEAEAEAPPSTIPLRVESHGKLIGKITFQEGGSSAESISSVFDTVFPTTLAADHGNLSGLLDDDHTQYVLADASRDVTIADTTNETFTVNQNDVTNNPAAVILNNIGTGDSLQLGDGTNDLFTVAADGTLNIVSTESEAINAIRYNTGTVGTRIALGHSGGSIAVPAAVQSGYQLGRVDFYGRTATGVDTSAQLMVFATETWNDAAIGSQIRLCATPNGTITPVNGITLDQDGTVIIGDGEAGTTLAAGNTLRAPDITTGGAGDVAGADLTITAGLGTGTGDAGQIIIQTPRVAAAGDNLQTRATLMTLDGSLVDIDGAQDITVADTENLVALTVNQNDVTNNPVAMLINNLSSDKSLVTNTGTYDDFQVGNGRVDVVREGGNAIFKFSSFGGNNRFNADHANGTIALPTATQLDDVLFQTACFGYGATAKTSTNIRMQCVATENYTDTQQGNKWVFSNTLTGGTNLNKSFIIDGTGYVGVGTGDTPLGPVSLLEARGPAGVGAASAGILTLSTSELTVVDGDQLGRINFQAPRESSGTDAILPGAAIWGEAEDTFDVAVNSTAIVFGTATSSAPVEMMRLGSTGKLMLADAILAQKLNIFESGNVRYGFGIQSGEMRSYVTNTGVHTWGEIDSADGTTYTEHMRLDANGLFRIGITDTIHSTINLAFAGASGTAGSLTGARDTNALLAGQAITSYSSWAKTPNDTWVDAGYIVFSADQTWANGDAPGRFQLYIAPDGSTTPTEALRVDRNHALTMFDNELVRPVLRDYGETVNALGDLGGGTDDIDLEDGNVVTATVSTSTETLTFSNPPASGTAGSFTLILTNGGSQTVNWPASVDWAGGGAPSLTAAGVDVLNFMTTDAGTTWLGFAAGLDMQ